MKIPFLSTPIYYANDKPHIGHLYSTLLLSVWKELTNLVGRKSFATTGLDEHGQKVATAAELKGFSAQDYVNGLSNEFAQFFKSFELQWDKWVRTTEPSHQEAVQHFWKILEEKGHIYKGVYKGWYILSEETYLTGDDSYYATLKDPNIVWREEECYYFRLSAFEEKLKQYYKTHPDFIYPKKRYNEAFSFLNQGLKDFVVSRPKSRLYWGVPVPGDDTQVIYVWVDALVNYLSSIGYPDKNYKKYWPGMHILGKDILKFHAIYWPALLMGAGIELPEKLIVHGWWLKDDAKISKSLGNTVALDELVAKYRIDGLRYFLIKGIAIGEDGNFKEELIKKVVYSDLANKYGNVFLRILGMVELIFDNDCSQRTQLIIGDAEKRVIEKVAIVHDMLESVVDDPVLIHEYANKLMDSIIAMNEYLQEKRIWEYTDIVAQLNDVYFLLDLFRKATILASPIMPIVAKEVLHYLGCEPSLKHYDKKLPDSFSHDKPVLFPK